jgi:O-antigen biosynthesis rhamnosyltransferase
MLKILHIYKNYYPFSIGGVEQHIYSLSESLYPLNVSSTVLTTHDSAQTGMVGKSQVHYLRAHINMASCPISFSLLKNFSRFARDFDILHYHFPWPCADLAQLLTQAHQPVVVTYHSDIVRQKWLKRIYHPVMQLFLKRADVIIASSEPYRQSSPVLRKYAAKTTVIPFGLDHRQYNVPDNATLLRWQERVGQGFFLFVGVLRYYKGLDFLLQAVQNTPIRVVIAGAGPEAARLIALKNAQKMENVHFVGQVGETDKAALYHLCRAAVAPSHLRTEAFCISLLESLIYGKPAISTELGTGTSFVNQHEVSGLVVPPANPPALRAAMERLLMDEALYQRLTAGAKRHYAQHFTVETMRDRHLELYQSITKPVIPTQVGIYL